MICYNHQLLHPSIQRIKTNLSLEKKALPKKLLFPRSFFDKTFLKSFIFSKVFCEAKKFKYMHYKCDFS